MHSARFTGLGSQAADGPGWGRWLTGMVVALGLAVALTGCGGGGDEPRASAAVTIGADGGSVVAEGVTIVIPPGAMVADATIRIAKDSTGAPAPPQWASAAGDMVAITPHGSVFAEPVTVRLPMPDVTLQANQRLYIAKVQPGGEWQVLGETVRKDKLLEVQVTSFSFFVPVVVTSLPPILGAEVIAPFEVTSLALACDGQPCGGALLRPWTITATVTHNGGPFPTDCLDPRIEIRTSDLSRPPTSTPATGPVIQVSFPMPLTREVITFGDMYVTAALLCKDARTNAISRLQGRSAGFRFPSGLDFGTPGAPVVREFPATLVQVPGDTPTLRAILARGASATEIRSGNATAPTGPGQAVVYLERLSSGDTAWRNVESRDQMRANPNPLGLPSFMDWRYWGVDFTLAPLTLADNDALYRIRACYRETPQATADCAAGPTARLTVVQQAQAPGFTLEPRSVLVTPGQTASFSVVAAGLPAPTLQWQTRLANSTSAWRDVRTGNGATTANYTTPAIGLADNGVQYRAVATSSAGSTPSQAVTVSVGPSAEPASIVSQPAPLTVLAGSEAVFAVSARGTEALSYQWHKDGQPISGANSPQLKMSNVTAGQAGNYFVQVSNAVGPAVDSTAVRLTVTDAAPGSAPPSIVTQPAAVAVTEGNVATFAVGVSGSGPLSFQWRRNGLDIAGATAAAYTLPAVASSDSGTYSVRVFNSAGNVTSQSATLAVAAATAQPVAVAPIITAQPGSVVVAPGMGAALAVGVQGSGPISYRWLRNGVALPGQTQASYTIGAAAAGDAGSYQVQVSNAAGGPVTSAAAQVILLGAPAINAQPVGAGAVEGSTATFSVTATGDAVRYQWTRNSIAITGATSASYTTPALTLADSGAVYGVVVYNGAGVVISQGAVLTVTPARIAPTTTLQPVNVTVDAGLPANFCMAFSGTPPFTLEMLRWVNGAWAPFGSAIAVNNNGPVCLSTPQLQLADNGAQFLFVAGNGAVSEALTNVVTVTVVPVVTPGMALYAGNFSYGGGGGALDGTGTEAFFDFPEGLAADSAGNLYVAQSNGHRLARIAPGGVVTTLATYSIATATTFLSQLALAPDGSLYTAGTSWCGLFRTAPPLAVGATTAELNVTGCGIETRGIAVDANGVVYLSLTTDNTIVRIATPDGSGNTSAAVFAGGGNRFVAPGSSDGTGAGARFTAPRGIAFGPGGDLFVADSGNHTIRRITPAGVVTTFAGTAGSAGTVDASGSAARFHTPTDLAFEADGNLLVLERGTFANGFANYVRRITPAGAVSTLFNVGDEAAALATPAQEQFARSPKGLAVLGPKRIALTVGNAVLIRTLP